MRQPHGVKKRVWLWYLVGIVAAVVLWPAVEEGANWWRNTFRAIATPSYPYASTYLLLWIDESGQSSWLEGQNDSRLWDVNGRPAISPMEHDTVLCNVFIRLRSWSRGWFHREQQSVSISPIMWFDSRRRDWHYLADLQYDPTRSPYREASAWRGEIWEYAQRHNVRPLPEARETREALLSGSATQVFLGRMHRRVRWELVPAVVAAGLVVGTLGAVLSDPRTILWVNRRILRRHKNGCCVRCGYRLGGLPAGSPCPECGGADRTGVSDA